jgi:hypothetical protein
MVISPVFSPREDLLVGRGEGREKRGEERKHGTEENTHSQNTSPHLPAHIFLIYSQKCKYKNASQSTRAGKQAPNPCYLVSKLRRESLNRRMKAPLNTRNNQNYRNSRAVRAVVSGRHRSPYLRKPDNCSPGRKFHSCNQTKKNSGCGSQAIEPPPSSQKLDVTNGDSGANKSQFFAGEKRKPRPKSQQSDGLKHQMERLRHTNWKSGETKVVYKRRHRCAHRRENKARRERERETTVAGSVGEPQV